MGAILMVSANLTILGLPKIKVFWIKGYDLIIYVHDPHNLCPWRHKKILSRNLNYIADVVMRPIFSSVWVSFHEYSRFIGQQGKAEDMSLTPLYHLHLPHRHFL